MSIAHEQALNHIFVHIVLDCDDSGILIKDDLGYPPCAQKIFASCEIFKIISDETAKRTFKNFPTSFQETVYNGKKKKSEWFFGNVPPVKHF